MDPHSHSSSAGAFLPAILHVVRGLANSSGTTHIVNSLAEAQARLGCRVAVFHVAKPGESSVTADPALVEDAMHPMTVPLDNPGLSWAFARTLARRIREFDVVHVHAVWNFPTFWAMRTARAAGVPYLVAPQGSFDPWALSQNRWGKRLYGALTEIPLLQQAHRLQATTGSERDSLRAAGLKPPVVVIPNGVDPTAFRPGGASLARELRLPEGERTLLFLSRLHPKKGLDILLRAFAAMPRSHRVTLVVAGSDAGSGYKAEMERLARELGVAANCRFVGEVAGGRKLEMLRGADAFALLSRSEGLPVAALEALACARPAVLSTGCNLPGVIEAGAGWVVEPEPGDAGRALAEVFGDYPAAVERGRRARSLVEDRFTWERIAVQTLETYRDMLSASPARGRQDSVQS